MTERPTTPDEDPDFDSKESWKESQEVEMMFEYLETKDKDSLIELICNSDEYEHLLLSDEFQTFLSYKCEEAFEPDPDREYDERRDREANQ